MSKQEDIREGIEAVIKGFEDAEKWSGVITDDLINYLHSKRVVIRVDYESYEVLGNEPYVAVEPLIEEVSNV